MSQDGQYLCVLRATRLGMLTEGPNESEGDAIGAHFAYLQELLATGRLLMAGRTLNSDERTIGIAIYVADSFEAARAIAEDDPVVIRGVMTFEIFPYRVALWAAGAET